MKSKKQLIKKSLIGSAITTASFALMNTVAFAALTVGEAPDVPQTPLRQLVLTIVNYFLTFLGIVAVIMIIYGGILYVTAAGKEETVGNAKKIIMYSLIGIIIILLSFALVTTILGAGTGVEQ